MKQWKIYLLWISVTEGVGTLAGLLTMDAMDQYGGVIVQPPFAPPSWVFPVVWIILYALMGIGAALVSLSVDSPYRNRALNVFVAQLIVNFFWSLIFFRASAYGFAFFWLLLLWVLVLWMIIAFWKADRTAAIMQIPYLLWVSFAAYLNYCVWQLN